MIGQSSTSCVVFLRRCVNPRWKTVTATPFCLCCYGLRCGNVWTGGKGAARVTLLHDKALMLYNPNSFNSSPQL